MTWALCDRSTPPQRQSKLRNRVTREYLVPPKHTDRTAERGSAEGSGVCLYVAQTASSAPRPTATVESIDPEETMDQVAGDFLQHAGTCRYCTPVNNYDERCSSASDSFLGQGEVQKLVPLRGYPPGHRLFFRADPACHLGGLQVTRAIG